MHPATRRFIEVMTEDIQRWEQAAHHIEVILPNIIEPDREQWRERAKAYRERAEEIKAMVEQAKVEPDFR